MNIRRVTTLDEAALRELWEEFEREVPEPPGAVPETWDEEWADVRRDIDAGAVFIAEDEEGSAPPAHPRRSAARRTCTWFTSGRARAARASPRRAARRASRRRGGRAGRG